MNLCWCCRQPFERPEELAASEPATTCERELCRRYDRWYRQCLAVRKGPFYGTEVFIPTGRVLSMEEIREMFA